MPKIKRSLEDTKPLNKTYKYILDENNKYHRIGADDITRTFESLVVTPKGNKYKAVPNVDNSEEGIKFIDKISSRPKSYIREGFIGEPGLELIHPEFDLLSLSPIVKKGINYASNKILNNKLLKIAKSIKTITKENASKITPDQWTAAQDAAIARGDISEAQRLRDLHFKVSAPNTQIKDIQYHGSKGNAKFNVFDPKLIGQTDQGWAGRGYYFTPAKDYAKMYASEPRAFYINAKKVHDGTSSNYFGREDSPAAEVFKRIRKKRGVDVQPILDDLISSDAIRTSFKQTNPYNGTFEEVVTRNNNQMKLADAITYDDKGIRIPLGERDNFNSNDIRYALMPFIVGGTGYGIYNRGKKRNGGSNNIGSYKRSIEDAGRISDEEYYNIMEGVAERNYRYWGFPNSDAALLYTLNNNTYNYRGYYNKYPKGDGNAKDHWPDDFKTVYHPTFSNESIYSGKKSQYNPKGLKSGYWIGKTFMPANWQRTNIGEETFRPINWQRNEKKNGGKSTNYVTTGGTGYVFPAINVNGVINKISNLWNYSKTYLKNKYNGTGDGTFIDLSNKNVSRIKSNTKGVKTILTNEFVERNKNTIRKKKDFINTSDTLLGDKKIPLSKISTYYGIENGKLKAGPLDIFNNETTIIPNRAKYIGKIKEVNPGKPESKEFKDAINKGVEQYNKEHGYEADWIFKLLPFARYNNPKAILYSNLLEEYRGYKDAHSKASNKRNEIVNNLRKKYSNLGAGELPYLVTENNDTIRGYKLNASPKVMFANEKGNAAFVSNIKNPDNINRLNKFLKNNPSYPIMIDNGRYSSYMDTFPNAEVYGGLNRPDDMFIIGTTDRIKHKEGGIHIAPSKRGTFTAAATKHNMEVREFASRVLRNKDSYSSTMVKKANFARNANKWNK